MSPFTRHAGLFGLPLAALAIVRTEAWDFPFMAMGCVAAFGLGGLYAAQLQGPAVLPQPVPWWASLSAGVAYVISLFVLLPGTAVLLGGMIPWLTLLYAVAMPWWLGVIVARGLVAARI